SYEEFEAAYGPYLHSFLETRTLVGNPFDSIWGIGMSTSFGEDYPAVVKDFIQSFFARLKEDARVLDVGTGNGAASMLGRQRSSRFRLIGIDTAKFKKPPASQNISVLKMDAGSLGFEDNAFDAVVSINGIEY